jgi:hypothetical protein
MTINPPNKALHSDAYSVEVRVFFTLSCAVGAGELESLAADAPAMSRLILCLCLLVSFAAATLAEETFWSDNKITVDQPFPAKVRAVSLAWSGYDLLLEEIDGANRLCIARLYIGRPLEYKIVSESDAKTEMMKVAKLTGNAWTHLSPGIDVNRFSWSIGAWRLGGNFGEVDLLRKVVRKERK